MEATDQFTEFGNAGDWQHAHEAFASEARIAVRRLIILRSRFSGNLSRGFG
jgi:hypothetical protein